MGENPENKKFQSTSQIFEISRQSGTPGASLWDDGAVVSIQERRSAALTIKNSL